MTTITREQAIDALVEQDIASMQDTLNHQDHDWPDEVFRKGWRGYESMTNEQLKTWYGDYFNILREDLEITD